MTTYVIRQALKNLTGLQQDIDNLKQTIADLKYCDPKYPSHHIDSMPHGSGQSSPTEQAAIAAVSTQEKYATELRNKLRLMRAIQSQLIMQLPDSTEYKVTQMRYMTKYPASYQCIAMRLNYSYSMVRLVEANFIKRILIYYDTHR